MLFPLFATGVVDTGGKFATGINNTSETGGKICHRSRWHRWQICRRCRWYRWCTFTCEYLREFSTKFETVLMGYSGAGGKLIHEKTRSKKSRDTVPLIHLRICNCWMSQEFADLQVANFKKKVACTPLQTGIWVSGLACWVPPWVCILGGFNVSNLMGITRRMIDIVKKITFYFLQNVWKCLVFSHLNFKIAKSAIMTQKIFLLKNINMGIKKRRILCWFQIRWCRLKQMPLKQARAQKLCEFWVFSFLCIFPWFFAFNFC